MEKEKQQDEDNTTQRQQIPVKRPDQQVSTKKMIFIASVPIVVLAGMIVFLFGPGQSFLLQNSGNSLPEITIERIEFQDGKIVALLRNTSPVIVTVAQADINDRIQPAAIEPSKNLSRLAVAKVIIPFSWNPGEPYEVGITTSDGVRFKKSVEAAALSPTANAEQISFFTIIGTYVGIIPILIGLLWFPFIKRLSKGKYNFFLALTAGLLVFLGIDAIVEGNKIAAENVAGVFNGQMLIAMVTIVSFLALLYVSEKLIGRANTIEKKKKEKSEASLVHQQLQPSSISSMSSSYSASAKQQQQFSKPFTIALMISIGIGLHNLGEGLAIGAAVLLGKAALSTFLIVGFTLHNTTEGLAIVAPMARSANKVIIRKLIGMGLIAGAPAIVGAWIGGFLYSPIAAIIFLSIGAGAIFQVVFSILSWIADNNNNVSSGNVQMEERRKKSWLNTSLIAGFIVGMVIMYVTSLMVSS
jgi:ZIP family zinc transporter